MAKLMKLFGQCVLLWVLFWTGNQISLITGLPIPGTVWGMVLLFVLLLSGIIKLHYVQDAADLLLRHMLFFFIPIAVGLMNWGEVFYNYGLVLAVSLIMGAVIPFLVVGTVTQYIHRRDK